MVKKYQKSLEDLSCKLVRSGDDFDFILLDIAQRDAVKEYLLFHNFILFDEEENKLNFKKFEDTILIDIDIDIDINTIFLKTFFYDIKTEQALKELYFHDPKKYTKCVNTLRYTLLLRGFSKKYFNFFLENREYIINNNYCLKHLSSSPFRKPIKNFDTFLNIVKRDHFSLLSYLKFKYILQYLKVKFLRKRGKIITFLGVDGAGKTTVIEKLQKGLGYKSYYLGDRSIRWSKFYQVSYLKPISIFIQYLEKLLRVFKIYLFTLRGKNIITDRYYFQEDRKSIKGKLYHLLYNKFFIKPDIVIVLWADSEVILSRKQEITQKDIEKFNKKIEELPFKNIVKIKNESLDITLNKILEIIR